jgi:phage regulator Rha-like protein
MDSREIAELTSKRHFDVCKDIETQLGKLDGGVRKFAHTYRNEQNGQEYRGYKLPYRETMILISGYSVELRAAVVDRWLELESKEQASLEFEKSSKKARNSLTAQWQEHGLVGKEFAIATIEEYKSIFNDPKIRKPVMSKEQKARLLIFETMEMLKLQSTPEVKGLPMVKTSIVSTAEAMQTALVSIGVE